MPRSFTIVPRIVPRIVLRTVSRHHSKFVSGFVACVLILALLTSCTLAIDPNFQPKANSHQIEPGAGEWQHWVLASNDEVMPAAPPDQEATLAEIAHLKELEAERDDAALAQIAYWNAGAPNYRWMQIAVAESAKAQIGPGARYARNIALLNIAIYDAMVAAWDAKYTYNRERPSEVDSSLTTVIEPANSPSYPSEHAVAAGAASAVLSYLFPDFAADFEAKAQEAVQSRLLAGVEYPSDVEAGLALGRAVAEQVIAHGKADGTDTAWDGAMPTGDGYWTGENPILPTAGSWTPWMMSSSDQFLPPPPPAYDSDQMQLELTALKEMTPTFAHTAAAYFWQAPTGGMAYTYNNAHRLIFENGLDANPVEAARIYAALSATHFDSFVSCWQAKYTYWSMRPFQIDPEFVQLFPAPNHPSYPSGHSCGSAGSATILGHFFPNDAEALMAGAYEAGDSRMWAGIHFQSDIDAGLEIGHLVGELGIERAEAMLKPSE